MSESIGQRVARAAWMAMNGDKEWAEMAWNDMGGAEPTWERANLEIAVEEALGHDALVAAVESVRALHRRVTLHEPLGVFPICAVCVGDEQFGQAYYPCPTIVAIDAAMLPND